MIITEKTDSIVLCAPIELRGKQMRYLFSEAWNIDPPILQGVNAVM